MSGVTIDVKIIDAEVKQLLAQIRQRSGNLTPAMKIIGQIVRSSVVKNFESEGRPTPWKKSKRARKEGGRTLTKGGHLMKSITPKSGPTSVEIGTNLIYARIHQLGGPVNHPARTRILHFAPKDGRKKSSPNLFSKANKKAKFAIKVAGKAYTITMPKREFLMVQPEDWREIEAALTDYVLNLK